MSLIVNVRVTNTIRRSVLYSPNSWNFYRRATPVGKGEAAALLPNDTATALIPRQVRRSSIPPTSLRVDDDETDNFDEWASNPRQKLHEQRWDSTVPGLPRTSLMQQQTSAKLRREPWHRYSNGSDTWDSSRRGMQTSTGMVSEDCTSILPTRMRSVDAIDDTDLISLNEADDDRCSHHEDDLLHPMKEHRDLQYNPDNQWSDEDDGDTKDDGETKRYGTTKILAAVMGIGAVGVMAGRALAQDDDIDDGTGANTCHDGGTGGTAQPDASHSMHVDLSQATQGGLSQPLPDVTHAVQMASTPPVPVVSPAELQIVQQMAMQAASNAASAASSAASAVAGAGAAAIGSVVT
jgi:hypothetical protein